MKRVSESIESVGYLYADSAEEVYMAFSPSGEGIHEKPQYADNEWLIWKKLYRIRFIVEPVED